MSDPKYVYPYPAQGMLFSLFLNSSFTKAILAGSLIYIGVSLGLQLQ